MFTVTLYIKKQDSFSVNSWGKVQIYDSIADLQREVDVQILVPLDSNCSVAYHPIFVFPIGTNIISVAKKPNVIHEYHGYEIVWNMSPNREVIDFDTLPRDQDN